MANAALVVDFSGPLKDIGEQLGDIKGRQLIARLEIKDDFAALLSSTRHALANNMITVQADINDNIENRFRDTNTNINSIHQRVDEMMRAITRLEAKHDPPPPAVPRRR